MKHKILLKARLYYAVTENTPRKLYYAATTIKIFSFPPLN